MTTAIVTTEIAQPKKPKLLTAEDLLRLDSKGVKGELIRGEFCETVSAGAEHGEIAISFIYELGKFVKPRRLGRILGTNVGVLLERDPDTVREPDVMFISAERMPLTVRPDGYCEVIPDIAVEIESFTDSIAEVHDKARMWRSYGVPLVWAVYTNPRSIDVHRADGSITTLYEDDVLDCGEILPGFSVPVSDIFDL